MKEAMLLSYKITSEDFRDAAGF